MSVADIRTQMAAALRSISGLRATEYITDSISTPHAMFDYSVEPDLTFGRGADVYRFTGHVWVGRVTEVAGQKFADLLRDPASANGIKQTIEGWSGWSGVIDYARVTSIGVLEIALLGSAEYLRFPFDVEVVV